ncbi:MAG: cytochrome c-type biogenesis protein CcmH [Nitrospinae bacterium]|nr:cytochrome c-type biogenesis protein CcmH [Nitrospinota bacterium]
MNPIQISRVPWLLSVVFSLSWLLLFAGQTSFSQPGDILTEEQNARIKRLENLIISPCCLTQPVSMHPSEASEKIKEEIKEMVIRGLTEKEIKGYYVDKYGEQILSVPSSWIVWELPIFVFIIALAVLIVILKRWVR